MSRHPASAGCGPCAFQIPMRGNEKWRVTRKKKGDEFQIPMRGNEFYRNPAQANDPHCFKSP